MLQLAVQHADDLPLPLRRLRLDDFQSVRQGREGVAHLVRQRRKEPGFVLIASGDDSQLVTQGFKLLFNVCAIAQDFREADHLAFLVAQPDCVAGRPEPRTVGSQHSAIVIHVFALQAATCNSNSGMRLSTSSGVNKRRSGWPWSSLPG